MVLKDHAEYEPEVVAQIVNDLKAHNADVLLVTEKDWSKLQHVPPENWPCPIARPVLQLTFDRQEQEFQKAILDCVRLFKDED